jgi:hypothetical protein
MVSTKAVWIEWRGPKTKNEAELWGETRFDNPHTARIFINTKRGENPETFWHEMVHVFFHFHKHKVSPQKEEQLCRKLETIIMEVLA